MTTMVYVATASRTLAAMPPQQLPGGGGGITALMLDGDYDEDNYGNDYQDDKYMFYKPCDHILVFIVVVVLIITIGPIGPVFDVRRPKQRN